VSGVQPPVTAQPMKVPTEAEQLIRGAKGYLDILDTQGLQSPASQTGLERSPACGVTVTLGAQGVSRGQITLIFFYIGLIKKPSQIQISIFQKLCIIIQYIFSYYNSIHIFLL
jgi:hypothetical protein